MEVPVVVAGWLARTPLPRRLRRNRLLVASIAQQPKIGPILSRLTSENLPSIFTLAMFDEIAQDEEDAEDYDLEALEHRTEARGFREDDDAATLVGRGVGEDAVVFEIGDEDAEGDDDDAPKKRRGERHEGGEEHEREGLMKDD